jgi:hypothetical protein
MMSASSFDGSHDEFHLLFERAATPRASGHCTPPEWDALKEATSSKDTNLACLGSKSPAAARSTVCDGSLGKSSLGWRAARLRWGIPATIGRHDDKFWAFFLFAAGAGLRHLKLHGGKDAMIDGVAEPGIGARIASTKVIIHQRAAEITIQIGSFGWQGLGSATLRAVDPFNELRISLEGGGQGVTFAGNACRIYGLGGFGLVFRFAFFEEIHHGKL